MIKASLKKSFSLILAFIELTRPIGPFFIAVAVFIGQVIALKSLPKLDLLFFPLAASMLVTGSSFAFNDFIDHEIDKVNRPWAPIPSGRISRRAAAWYSLGLYLVGFIFSIPTGFWPIIVLNVAYFLSILYTLKLKVMGFLGNITVALCVSIAFIYGSLTATGVVYPMVFNIAWISFLINLGRDVVQSIQDMGGDVWRHVKSVAITYGPKAAALLGSSFTLLGLVLGPLLFLNQFTVNHDLYMYIQILILVPQIGLVYSIIMLLRKPTSMNASRFIRRANIFTGLILLVLVLMFVSSFL